MKDSDKRLEGAPVGGEALDKWIEKRLREMGLDEDDIGSVVEGGGGLHGMTGRWRICPRCKANIDMLTWVEGKEDGMQWPQILQTGEVECPNCGAYGESFGLNPMHEPHEKLKTFQAQRVHNPLPWASKYLKIGKSLVEQNNLFPADPMFDEDEPHWPRDLGACIVGAALMLVSTIKREMNPRPENKGNKKPTPHKPRDGNRR